MRLLAPVLALTCACASQREVVTRVPVRVETEPAGAMVTVSDASGRRALGRGPLDHELERTDSVFDSGTGMWIATGIAAVMGAVGGGMVASGSGDEAFRTEDSTMVGVGLGLAITGGVVGLITLPIALVWTAMDGDVTWSVAKNGPTAYEADMPGYRSASAIVDARSEGPFAVKLLLTPDDKAEVIGAVGGVGVRTVAAAPFVAVFEVEDRSGILDAKTVSALTDQLSTKLAEHRSFRVVPAADLRTRLAEAKKESYQACIDERCQIELGKAVAADRTVSTRVIKTGATCTLNGTVYDLKTEATDRAASVRGQCSVEALLDAVDALAQKLSTE